MKQINQDRLLLVTMVILFIILIFIFPAHATTINYADPLGTNQNLIYYQINNTTASYAGTFNTTSQVTLDPDGVYVTVVQPSGVGLLENPAEGLDWLGKCIVIAFMGVLCLSLVMGTVLLLFKSFM